MKSEMVSEVMFPLRGQIGLLRRCSGDIRVRLYSIEGMVRRQLVLTDLTVELGPEVRNRVYETVRRRITTPLDQVINAIGDEMAPWLGR